MKVLFITSAYPNSGNPAEGLFHQQHVLALTRAGIKGTVIVCKPWLPNRLAKIWGRYRSLACLPRYEEHNGIPVLYSRYLHIPKYRWLQLTVASCVNSVLRTVRPLHSCESYDVIHVHGTWPVGIVAPLISNALSCPFIVTMHLQDDPDLFTSRRGTGLYQEMLKKASAVVVVGRPLERFVKQWRSDLPEGPFQIIPNGVDLNAIQEVIQEVPSGSQGKGRIISVGNLWPVKGIDLNLRALADLDRLGIKWEFYTVVGDGPERKRLERLAQELGIRDRVCFKGRLPHRETLKEIVKADIFSLPSWQEAFGVVYLEAMACGKPAIGCWGQGAEDIIRHEKDGLLVKTKNVEELKAALSRLLKNHEYAHGLGRSATVRAREFTWERNAVQYLDVYRKVCGQRASERNRCSLQIIMA